MVPQVFMARTRWYGTTCAGKRTLLRLWLYYSVTLFDFHSTAVRLPSDCISTALRPFDDLRYDRI